MGGAMKNKNKMRKMFRTPLEERGFSVEAGEDVIFIRMREEVEQSISFAGRWDYLTNSFRFHFYVADCYPVLEKMFQDRFGQRIIYGASSPIHLLREDESLYEWPLDAPETPSIVLAQIDEYAIPFLDKYVDLEAVKERLESDYPGDWFSLGKEGRLCLLAAIMAFQGHRAEALKMIENALEERKDKMHKYRWRLEAMQACLIKQAESLNSESK